MAGMTLVVGLGVFEDETVGSLQPIGALLYAVRAVFEVEAFYTLVWALWGEHNKEERDEKMGYKEGGRQGVNKEEGGKGGSKRR